MKNTDIKIGVIGLGYVGLPLAIEFDKHFTVVGYDIDGKRVNTLRHNRHDSTGEVTHEELRDSTIEFTGQPDDLGKCNVYIITVPTPVNDANQPNLTPLIKASELVGRYICMQDVVIYESTVYPGATEEVCVPELEKASFKVFNRDFTVGYSPERINPGDPERSVTSIKKIVSGSTQETLNFVDFLYSTIIRAGVYRASTIQVAEAAKVIENTQRDVNIALINELAMIFNRMNIDTLEVLEAAGTKWNFLPFRPGLVGGHCIGVDPYYLTHKAQQIGYHPEVILAGRRVNDGMGPYIGQQVVKAMATNSQRIAGSRVLIMGYTFKENCPDIRNTRVGDIIQELREHNIEVDLFDPVMNRNERLPEEHRCRRIQVLTPEHQAYYDGIVIAVAHDYFKDMGAQHIRRYGTQRALLFDVKSMFSPLLTDWRL